MQATFFFGPEVPKVMQEVLHHETLRYDISVDGTITRFLEMPDYLTALRIFGNWARMTDEAFHPYLQLHQEKNLILRMFDRIDTWTSGADRVLAPRYRP